MQELKNTCLSYKDLISTQSQFYQHNMRWCLKLIMDI